MAFANARTAPLQTFGDRFLACLHQHGSAGHDYANGNALLRGATSTRNLADAVTFLSNLHGRSPGVIAHAASRTTDREARSWLEEALDAFAAERALVARLAVEAGSAPATIGAAGAEATLLAQRHTLDMLAQSERNGCGLGAALGLAADWGGIRFILNTAAGRLGVTVPTCRLPDETQVAAIAADFATTPAIERAMLFGAEQLLLQHKGMWDVLEARAFARDPG